METPEVVKRASRCPFAHSHGLVQAIAESFYAVFPAGRGSKELSIEAASEEFIRILLENREQIAPIAQYGMQSRLAEYISSSQKDPVQFCFIDDEHLTKVMVTAFQNFVCNLDNASKWRGFSQESLFACLKNYTGGIEIVVKIFLAIIESYKEQYKKYPEPAALKKMEGSMVNIAHAVGRGPKLYAKILREYIREGAAGMKNIFYFTEDGSIHERAEIGKSIEDDLNETCAHMASRDVMPDAFYGKHCAGLAMIPKLAHMMNTILFDLYQEVYEQGKSTKQTT